MVTPKYESGDEFHLGADGQVKITEIYRIDEEDNKVVYTVKYLDHAGQPESTLSEQELEEVN